MAPQPVAQVVVNVFRCQALVGASRALSARRGYASRRLLGVARVVTPGAGRTAMDATLDKREVAISVHNLYTM